MPRKAKEPEPKNQKLSVTTLVDPEKYRLLRLLSVQTDREIKELVDEALELLLTKHSGQIPRLPQPA